MLRGYIRPDQYVSEAVQRKLLEAADVPDARTYVESKRAGETLPIRQKAIDALRPGDVLVVAWLSRLARGRADLRAVVKQIVDKGCTILEAGTGVASTDTRWTCIVTYAVDWWTGDARRLPPKKRRERAALGGQALHEKAAVGKMQRVEAEKVWRDHKRYPKDAEAAAKTGWSKRTLNTWFGASGRKPGKPKTRK